MKTIFVLVVAAMVSFGASAQARRVAALDWMSGTWIAESERERVSETWLGPSNGLMVAANLTTRGPERKSFEFMRISETPEGFSFFASPGGRSPVEFKLKELGERRVTFENTGHDFPQRVLYWREGEVLMARIEGVIRGEPRSQQWRFARKP
jgi:hypothetical protein